MDEVQYDVVDECLDDEDSLHEESEENKVSSTQYSYPCLLLEGETTSVDFQYLLSILAREKTDDNEIPVYLNFKGIIKKFGYVKMDLNSLFDFYYTLNYKLTFCQDESNSKVLDLNDGNLLEKFILYGGEI